MEVFYSLSLVAGMLAGLVPILYMLAREKLSILTLMLSLVLYISTSVFGLQLMNDEVSDRFMPQLQLVMLSFSRSLLVGMLGFVVIFAISCFVMLEESSEPTNPRL